MAATLKRSEKRLKICPWCGETAELYQEKGMGWAIECNNDDCDGFKGFYPTQEIAVSRWNTRFIDKMEEKVSSG